MKHPGPLSGVRVTDLTATFMGPYCTQILADMGADVIKIEPPAGDTTRYVSVGPEPAMAGVFVNVNRGKRSAVLDLRTAGDKQALRRIAERTDVFIHSMRAQAIGRLGFGYDDVAALNPSVVYVNCYGFGRRGTDAGRVAYDDIIQAESGMVAAQEQLTGEASYSATIMADKISGLTAVYATVMALFHRERTGEGQEVEVPMFETMASFMLAEHANGALFTPPLGPAAYPRPVAPNRKPYRTKDGYISALVYSDKQWAAFTGAVRPSWDSPEFATLELRSRQIDRVYGLLGETFATRTTGEWLDLLRPLDIPCAPVRSLDELFDSEHLNSAGFFETVEAPYGPVRFPGPPAWFSRTPGRVAGPAPRLGEHTSQVRDEINGQDPS
ncbi:MAG: CoA transferase [Streptosporangiales bacterium]|nr:CoA transferase [Streptosporangiales bacterium]